jgi:ubiquinone/menaquinone biosynthesis C-methylase UbiE
MSDKDSAPIPMSYKKADHLLNPLRKFVLSPSKLVDRLSLSQSANVLELGCGPGYYSAKVAQKIPSGKLTLVDIQQEMLEMAKRRVDSFGIFNINYVLADATELPFGDETFDVIFLIAMLGEIPDEEKCVGELHRALRTGGLLSVSEQSYDPHFIPAFKMKILIGDVFNFEREFGNNHNYTLNFRKQR